MLVWNQTRYNTDDLVAIIRASGEERVKKFDWIVTYFNASGQPYAPGTHGPFVKMDRNADERLTTKKIGIVRPSQMPNVPDIVRLMSQAEGIAPEGALIEVYARVKGALDHHDSSTVCSFYAASGTYKYDLEKVHALMQSLNLRLRFAPKEISRSEMASREKEWNLLHARRLSEQQLARAKADARTHEQHIERAHRSIEQLRSLITSEENLLASARASIAPLGDHVKQAEEELIKHQQSMTDSGYTISRFLSNLE